MKRRTVEGHREALRIAGNQDAWGASESSLVRLLVGVFLVKGAAGLSAVFGGGVPSERCGFGGVVFWH